MPENKNDQPSNAQGVIESNSHNDGNNNNTQRVPKDLGSVEERQQEETSDENHARQGKTGQGAVVNDRIQRD